MSGLPPSAGGPPVLHPSVFLAAGSVVVGDVRIGAESSVWFNTVLRGDTDRIEIGERTNLQDLTVVHMDEGIPALIGNRVTVGHRVILHGCTIEDDCLIGMGAIIMNGVRIGAGSLIGAGALVLEGHVIPPGSVVLGAPATVVGQVKPAHRDAIARGTAHYVELARSHMAGGFPGPGARRGSAGGAASREGTAGGAASPPPTKDREGP